MTKFYIYLINESSHGLHCTQLLQKKSIQSVYQRQMALEEEQGKKPLLSFNLSEILVFESSNVSELNK